MLEVLNLGAGVQSTTVLLMSLEGLLPPLDYVIFADTGWEPQEVYRHLEWLKTLTTVHVVKNGNIAKDAMRYQVNHHDSSTRQLQRGMGDDGKTRWGSMPFFILGPNGEQGMIRRQCTYEYKIRPIERFVRRTVLGLKPRQRAPKEKVIRQWYGISLDEMQRMSKDFNAFTTNYYPLIEKRMTRQHCIEWLEQRGILAPRSACIGCPFHHDKEWRNLKDNSPDEWQEAVEFDEAIRHWGGMRGEVYLHSARIPLAEVDLTTDVERGQLLLWQDECMGMCGV